MYKRKDWIYTYGADGGGSDDSSSSSDDDSSVLESQDGTGKSCKLVVECIHIAHNQNATACLQSTPAATEKQLAMAANQKKV